MFQHDIAYGDFKDLFRRTASDEILHDKAFNIAKNPKHDGYQRGLPSMVSEFCDEKLLCLQINLRMIKIKMIKMRICQARN